MTTRLATPDDLTRRMGITVESERTALLADASAAVIIVHGPAVRAGDDHRPRAGAVGPEGSARAAPRSRRRRRHGPERQPAPVHFDGIDTVHVTVNLDSFSFEPWASPIHTVNVTYDHGFDAIPDDIVVVVCQGRDLQDRPQDGHRAPHEQLGDWATRPVPRPHPVRSAIAAGTGSP